MCEKLLAKLSVVIIFTGADACSCQSVVWRVAINCKPETAGTAAMAEWTGQTASNTAVLHDPKNIYETTAVVENIQQIVVQHANWKSRSRHQNGAPSATIRRPISAQIENYWRWGFRKLLPSDLADLRQTTNNFLNLFSALSLRPRVARQQLQWICVYPFRYIEQK